MARALSIIDPLRELFSLPRDFSDYSVRVERWAPPVDLCAKDGNWIIQAELPGVDPKEVHISVMGDQLTIRGERKVPEGLKEEDFLLQESPYGPFERTIVLPHAVPEDKVQATYKNGVLMIQLPAVGEQAREIEIQTDEQQRIEKPKKEESKKEEPTQGSKEEMPKAA